jgi:hypothetical protein
VKSAKARRGAKIIGEATLEYLADLHADCNLMRRPGTVLILAHVGPGGDVAAEIWPLHLAPHLKLPPRALRELGLDDLPVPGAPSRQT